MNTSMALAIIPDFFFCFLLYTSYVCNHQSCTQRYHIQCSAGYIAAEAKSKGHIASLRYRISQQTLYTSHFLVHFLILQFTANFLILRLGGSPAYIFCSSKCVDMRPCSTDSLYITMHVICNYNVMISVHCIVFHMTLLW